MTNQELIKKALEARQNSYSPYSNYKVGAALLTEEGKVYLGTNVENCGYSPSNCAERSAFFSAISNGDSKFTKLAVVGSSEGIAYPCGICRQVIVELAPNIEIICAKDENTYEVLTIKDLLPHAFTPDDVK
ncbi:MAG: cytidine deaminase [Clostridia bacterium]|nr:cytidine deaminase [Clostridia bacterium]